MNVFEKVSLTKCSSYDYDEVRKALIQSLSLIDGLSFVKAGVRVGIKVNLVSAHSPDRGVVTHPMLVECLCELLTERGASVIVGDSPGGLFTPVYIKNVYRVCGYNEIEAIKGTKLNDNFAVKDAEYSEAVSLKNFAYTAWLDDVDFIIDFSKLKTHAMMGMSCAVKNMFGCIPGTTKKDYHMRYSNEKAFANVMVDLNEYFKPVLYVVDAIDGMEGNGPTAGDKRHIGLILSSKKPYALDVACAAVINMDANDVATILAAKERGLGPGDVKEVEIVGDISISEARIRDFKRATIHQNITFEGGTFINNLASIAAKVLFDTRPQVYKKECVGCRKCSEVCPAKAITMVPYRGEKKTGSTGLVPRINSTKCIKCFCCQEFCPVGAMKVHHNALGAVISQMQR